MTEWSQVENVSVWGDSSKFIKKKEEKNYMLHKCKVEHLELGKASHLGLGAN